jgi:large subunit ribosomal protein L6
MSRIGKKPVPVPAGATVTLDGNTITAKGPKGQLVFVAHELVSVSMENGELVVTPKDDSKPSRSQWGTTRTMVANMVEGVTKGYERSLDLVGVGYRAQMKGSVLSMQLGFSHDVDYPPPAGVSFATPKPTEIVLTGIDKQLLGQVAAELRSYRPPEPYKGKGVKYRGEVVRRKEGKKK